MSGSSFLGGDSCPVLRFWAEFHVRFFVSGRDGVQRFLKTTTRARVPDIGWFSRKES